MNYNYKTTFKFDYVYEIEIDIKKLLKEKQFFFSSKINNLYDLLPLIKIVSNCLCGPNQKNIVKKFIEYNLNSNILDLFFELINLIKETIKNETLEKINTWKEL